MLRLGVCVFAVLVWATLSHIASLPSAADPEKQPMIAGRVVAQDGGHAVAGALVFAAPPIERRRRARDVKPLHAVTDREGRFQIRDVMPGQWMVFVHGGGWASTGLSAVRVGARNPFVRTVGAKGIGALELAAEPAGALEVRVTDSGGRPAPDCWVHAEWVRPWPYDLASTEAFRDLHTAKTDAEGLVRLPSLVPGLVAALVVRRPRLPHETVRGLRLESGEVRQIDVELPASRLIEVRVVDHDSGKGVPGAKLVLLVPDGEQGRHFTAMDSVDTEAVTDENGKARVAVIAKRSLQLAATCDGYLPLWSDLNSPVRVKDGVDSVEISLPRARSISGRVVAPMNVGPARSTVTLRSARGTGIIVETAEDGSFRFVELGPGTFDLRAEMLHEGRLYSAAKSVASGTEDVVLELREQRSKSGVPRHMVVKVLTAEGKSVQSCTVIVTGIGPGGYSRSWPEHESADGAYAIALPAGELWLDVYDVEGGRLGSTQIGPLEPRTSITVRLDVARTIKGRVVAPDGEPVEGATILAESRGANDDVGMEEHAKALSDHEGRFVLTGLSKMPYVITCEPALEYLIPDAIIAEGGSSEAVIELKRATEVAVTLVDPKGQPVAGAALRVQYADMQPPYAFAREGLDGHVSDAKGVVRLRGLDVRRPVILDVDPPPGRTDLRAIHDESWLMASGRLAFEAGREVRGVVRDASGQLIRDAEVIFDPGDGAYDSRHAFTDPEGKFALDGLPAGPLSLFARVPGLLIDRRSPAQAVRLAADEGRAELTIDLGKSVTVRVKEWDGDNSWNYATLVERPVDGVSSWREAMSAVSRNGEVTFRGLREGVLHTLWIHGLHGDRCVHVTDVIASDEVREVTTKSGRRVQGRFVPPDGVSVDLSRVQLRDRWGVEIECEFDALRFHTRDVPDHEWVAMAWGRGSDGKEYVGVGPVTFGEPFALPLRAR